MFRRAAPQAATPRHRARRPAHGVRPRTLGLPRTRRVLFRVKMCLRSTICVLRPRLLSNFPRRHHRRQPRAPRHLQY